MDEISQCDAVSVRSSVARQIGFRISGISLPQGRSGDDLAAL